MVNSGVITAVGLEDGAGKVGVLLLPSDGETEEEAVATAVLLLTAEVLRPLKVLGLLITLPAVLLLMAEALGLPVALLMVEALGLPEVLRPPGELRLLKVPEEPGLPVALLMVEALRLLEILRPLNVLAPLVTVVDEEPPVAPLLLLPALARRVTWIVTVYEGSNGPPAENVIWKTVGAESIGAVPVINGLVGSAKFGLSTIHGKGGMEEKPVGMSPTLCK
ncbi:hypothetical protein KVR01_001128 [Diaporthe batatas]|uniref:uncharacterized protein n=1 Tax=Diaporthe batatas TaxID=748121 RepID=UPI001D04E196|nr:uncharacterized protein KVR01_001128 [Diaporthe batatas]KAG8168379.1 hypothetical protein KVR01_001128 [Diaporthe batatas]